MYPTTHAEAPKEIIRLSWNRLRMLNLRAVLPLAASVVLFSFTPYLGAQEWTRFRGPNGSGLSHAQLAISPTTEQMAWSLDLPAGGHSSPVLWGSRLFLTGADPQSATRFVFAVETESGTNLWIREFPSETHKKHEFNSFASATCAVDDERLYALWSTPASLTVVALDHAGNDIWRRNLGKYVSKYGSGSSPILHKGVILFSAEQDREGGGVSSLIALDCRTGQDRWTAKRSSKHAPYSTPFLLEREGESPQVIFSSTAHGLSAIDPNSGKLLWEMPGALDKRSVGSGIVLDDKWVTASCGVGGGEVYHVIVAPPRANEHPEPKLVRKVNKHVSHVCSPIALGRRIYYWEDGGIVTCCDMESGDPVWTKRIGGNFFSSPVSAGRMIYNISTDGILIAIEAAEEFRELGRLKLGDGPCHSSPAISQGKLFVRTFDRLHCLGTNSGRIVHGGEK